MELTSEISLSTIGELNQKERRKRKIGILSAAFIGASIFMLGSLAFAQSTQTICKISQLAQESHCQCGDNCSCGTSCGCYLNGLK
jgi:amino acid transporter